GDPLRGGDGGAVLDHAWRGRRREEHAAAVTAGGAQPRRARAAALHRGDPAGRLPTVLAGLKQGWSFAWRSLMAAELLYFSLNLGNLLQAGRDLNDAARVIAVMLIIMAIGVGCDQVL